MSYDNALIAEKLREWEKHMNDFCLPVWEDIPNFGLYMEQVTILLHEYLNYLPSDKKDEQLITAAAINNYVRQKVMPEPKKKKYFRIHIAYLIIIITLKQGLSIAMIQKLIPSDLSEEEAREVYLSFAKRHSRVSSYFNEQVARLASPILGTESAGETSAEKPEDLITSAAITAGLSRLLAEKLLLLSHSDDDGANAKNDTEKPEKTKSEKKAEKEKEKEKGGKKAADSENEA